MAEHMNRLLVHANTTADETLARSTGGARNHPQQGCCRTMAYRSVPNGSRMWVEGVMSSSSTSTMNYLVEDEHWLSPTDLITHLDLRPGMNVAEIGAGTAYYAIPIATTVGPRGCVFAVEWRTWLREELLAHLRRPDSPPNIQLVNARAARTHLPSDCCDLVLLADIWHELQHPDEALAECRRILRPGGRLAILNWRPEASCPPGPPMEHRIPLQRTLRTVELDSWSLLKNEVLGSQDYLLVFEVTDESVQS